ncbi:alpha-crystallin A chain [Daphnia magna]|uniref:alpha-crystallin A chain n=1 Tax=Daphnia magna TaxID=35525 RepID=UPI001E1BB6F8|nr:alpha-crystallin A chain [Daphnia magna]
MSSFIVRNALGRLPRANLKLNKPQARGVFGRGFGSFDPSFRSLMRDMERTFNSLYQDVGRTFNQSMLPRALPHASLADEKPMYRLNIDMPGFKPEDIKISLKDRMLNIHAKMERKSDDGSRFFQEVCREYLLPETLKVEELKSIFTDDGVLCIEAPQPEAEKPLEIPIDRCEVPKREQLK